MRKFLFRALVVIALPLLTLTMAVGLEAPITVAGANIEKPIKTWTGTASWYGPGFNGRPTASGQPYDMYAATAAHPWLPLGSVVRVVNLSTGESQDVSYLLASRLSMLQPGTATVRIELLEQPQRHPQTP
jgi:rare lipoprotein A (peptidoglycan hydrolase)